MNLEYRNNEEKSIVLDRLANQFHEVLVKVAPANESGYREKMYRYFDEEEVANMEINETYSKKSIEDIFHERSDACGVSVNYKGIQTEISFNSFNSNGMTRDKGFFEPQIDIVFYADSLKSSNTMALYELKTNFEKKMQGIKVNIIDATSNYDLSRNAELERKIAEIGDSEKTKDHKELTLDFNKNNNKNIESTNAQN